MKARKHPVFAGMRFGRLTAVEEIDTGGIGRTQWLFVCDCGKQKILPTNYVTTGNTKSCGCLNRNSPLKKRPKKHGYCGTRIYRCWQGMKRRCAEKSKDHVLYFDRGIRVCEEWKDFECFYEWAMSHGYSDNLTLDRVNNDGNYEPSNCRWATAKEQANNKSTSLRIEHLGMTKTLAEWADYYGIKNSTIKSRFYRGDRGEKLFREARN